MRKLGLSKASMAALKAWDTRRSRKDKKAKTTLKKPFIKKWAPDKFMCQIYDQGLEFALISAKGEQCHPFAFCKDFLQDAIAAALNKKTATIYGFSYSSGKSPPVDLKKARVAVRLKGKPGFATKCKRSLSFLNKVERSLGLSPSKLLYGGKFGGDKIYVFVGDRRWLFSSPMISLYSLLIRKGMTYEKGGGWKKHLQSGKSLEHNDKLYSKDALPALELIRKQGVEKVFSSEIKKNYPKEVPTHEMHEAGIVAFAQGDIPARVSKNWQIKRA